MKDTPARISRWLTRWGAVVALLLVPAVAATAQTGGPYEVADPVANVLVFTETTQFRHTEAIDQGTPVLRQALADADITTVHTEDSSIFNDVDLATFDALLMFQTSGDPWTADEKAALERYQQAGGGIVAVHNATDMRGNYAWWDDMIGALMPGHAATGSSPGLPGTVLVEDGTHPSTEHLPTRWDRADEWYNYSANVRGEAHVLATMDESTYDPGGNAMGYDHPISWCRMYDGGRAWMTGMGHFGAHYTDEPFLVDHILGGVEWAAGLVEGDCGGTDWSEFERVTLDSNTSAPFAMDVASDGRVFFTELVRGQIRIHDPETQTTSTALTLDVYSGGEDGLLGIALDPDFDSNGHLFVYYSPDTADNSDPANFVSFLSRFTVEGNGIDPASEVVVMEVPASRLPDEPGHTGGGLRFGPDGDLYLSVGDDVNPHSEPSGGYAPLHSPPPTCGTPAPPRPTPTTCAASCCASTPSRTAATPSRPATSSTATGRRRCPRRTWRRCGPRSTPWASGTPSASSSTPSPATSAWRTTRRTTTATPRPPVALPGSRSGTGSPSRASTAGRCAWAPTSRSVTWTT